VTTTRAATETTTLGRYLVTKRLAAGGMADVLLARTTGIEGFERHVVIKRIHADLVEQDRYIKMFLDEARLAASLHHHNIVQVNDIGIDDGEYFFAMEYVHGEDARNLLMLASKRGELIPLEHAITIVTAAAAGLHHAHEQCGPDRTPLGIVHRDVSPANILIGFDGSVKVADFGIALAAHRAEQTQSGVLKGKVAYMSPEQCNCERVDRRSDVFSLGICLYELATVHPCFAGSNDFMTMSAIVAGTMRPPSKLNAHVTPALEAIIMKALASRPEDRYQSADDLRQALERYASDAGLRSSTTALADYMKQQFGTRPLPWLDEDAGSADDDLEISVLTEAEPLPPAEDLFLAIPVEAPATQSRPVKQTLPLRPVGPRQAMRALPDLRPPSRRDLRGDPTVPLHARGANEPSPPSQQTEPSTIVRAARAVRRLWLAGAIIAVILSGASLALVASDGDPAAVPARRAVSRPHVTPLPPAHLSVPVSEPGAPVAAEVSPEPVTSHPAATMTPAKRVTRNPARATASPSRAPAPAPAPAAHPAAKWNRDGLFPR
jgi:serine/threonine-protein kinase